MKVKIKTPGKYHEYVELEIIGRVDYQDMECFKEALNRFERLQTRKHYMNLGRTELLCSAAIDEIIDVKKHIESRGELFDVIDISGNIEAHLRDTNMFDELKPNLIGVFNIQKKIRTETPGKRLMEAGKRIPFIFNYGLPYTDVPRKTKVIVVDDVGMIRTHLRKAAEAAGCDVVGEAQDGEEAVSLSQTLKPDLIIMDIVMSRMDGITALKEIKKILPATKIIMVSSQAKPSNVIDSMRFGAANFVIKPFEEMYMSNLIKSTIMN